MPARGPRFASALLLVAFALHASTASDDPPHGASSGESPPTTFAPASPPAASATLLMTSALGSACDLTYAALVPTGMMTHVFALNFDVAFSPGKAPDQEAWFSIARGTSKRTLLPT